MITYQLTKGTRKHRLEEFYRILPLVKVTLDDWKQLLKEKEKLRVYEERKEELENAIKAANNLINNELFSFGVAQVEILKEGIKELEGKMSKTTESLMVLGSSVYELKNKVLYYEHYFVNIMQSIVYDNESLLDKKDVDTKYIREYFYLMLVIKKENGDAFDSRLIVTDEAYDYLMNFIREHKEKGDYYYRNKQHRKLKIVEFLEIFG